MKQFVLILLLIYLLFIFSNCDAIEAKNTIKEEPYYILFLHNKFLEENDLAAKHPEYGRAEYTEILDSFRNTGFIVLSEKRASNTDVVKYAIKIVSQIDSLIMSGVKPNHITVIGTSKGGYIAQYVSTFLKKPDLNFVFIGCFQQSDLVNKPEINFCGNILTIYEKSDSNGTSAIKRKETTKLKISNFKEIELNTNLKHGFLFKALPEWIEPCKMWAKGNYQLR